MIEIIFCKIKNLTVATYTLPFEFLGLKVKPLCNSYFKRGWVVLKFGGMDGTRTRDPLRDRQVF